MSSNARAVRSASALVSQERLWTRLMAMAEIGRVGATGVNRAAFSAEDIEARRLLVNWGRALGMTASHDAIGNLFLRLQGTDANAPALLAGSHLDSQPSGGRFDGVFGVLAALEAVEALRELGTPIMRSIEVVAWANEEGGRFGPGAMGSQVFAGLRTAADFQNVTDSEGVTLGDALQATLRALPEVAPRAHRQAPAVYLEAHIEQGPCLERAGRPVGAVSGIQGCQWLEFVVTGDAAHAGTTPLADRRDALLSAMDLIATLRALCLSDAPDSRFTIGRCTVEPNTPNTVPCRTTFTVDFRHPARDVFARVADALLAAPRSGNCEIQVRQLFRHDPVAFPARVTEAVDEAVSHVSCENLRLTSGAFHDALFLATCCPTGMVFVRCRDGISHNPREYASPEDLALGTRVLTRAIETLSG
jgi:beta-ureidopropionase / N-carbamoyl-L-amino-acid hydrolase